MALVEDVKGRIVDSIIRGCELFDGISSSEMAQLPQKLALQHRVFAANDRICSTGEIGDSIWIIVSGTIEVFREVEGAALTLTTRRAGEVVGEQAFLGGTRTTCMRAMTRVEALTLKRDLLDAGEDQEVKAIVWRNVARILSAKLAQASDQRTELTVQGAEAETFLSRFVNPHGLDHVRGGLRTGYTQENVVVWFSDLVGFGAVSAAVEPDAVAALIRNCMQQQSDIIEASGGYVDKFMGDGLMAFWTFPTSDTMARSACLKAMHAAQEAIRAIEGTKSPLADHRLALRVGLHVGSAVSGNFGSETRWAYTLIGQDVNIAARLEQAKEKDDTGAPLGPLRVSEEFRALLPTEKQEQVRQAVRIHVKELKRTIYCGDSGA